MSNKIQGSNESNKMNTTVQYFDLVKYLYIQYVATYARGYHEAASRSNLMYWCE